MSLPDYLAHAQVTFSDPLSQRALTLSVPFEEAEKLFETPKKSLSSPLQSIVFVIRTRDSYENFCKDLFLPLTIHIAFKVDKVVRLLFAVTLACIIDLLTLPIRIITLIPRMVYQARESRPEILTAIEKYGYSEAQHFQLLKISVLFNPKWQIGGNLCCEKYEQTSIYPLTDLPFGCFERQLTKQEFPVKDTVVRNYPKIAFDQTIELSCEDEDFEKLKIRVYTNQSEIREYCHSIFTIDFSSYPVCKLTRRQAPLPPPLHAQPVKRPLLVKQLSSDAEIIKNIGKIARNWQVLASMKGQHAESNEHIFGDLYTASKLIAQCMEKPEATKWIWNKVYVCQDVALSEIQAIALVHSTKKECKIAHIATHPRNVRSLINQEEITRVEGAGSALIDHFKKELKAGAYQRIYLESMDSAVPFYSKLGFTKLDLLSCMLDEPGTTPMAIMANT